MAGAVRGWNNLGKKGWGGKGLRMLLGGTATGAGLGGTVAGGLGIVSGGTTTAIAKGAMAGAAGVRAYDFVKERQDKADEKTVERSFVRLMKEKKVSFDDTEIIAKMKKAVFEKYDMDKIEGERERKEKDRRYRLYAGAGAFASMLFLGEYGGRMAKGAGKGLGNAWDSVVGDGSVPSGDVSEFATVDESLAPESGEGVVNGGGRDYISENGDVTGMPEQTTSPDWEQIVEKDNLPEIHDVKVTVEKGDNLWKIIEDQLEESSKFDGMNAEQRVHFIDDLKDDFANMTEAQRAEIGFKRPGDIGFIVPNQKLDLSSVLGDDSVVEKARLDALGLSEDKISSIKENLAGGGVEKLSAEVPEVSAPTEVPIIETNSVIPERVDPATSQMLNRMGFTPEKFNSVKNMTIEQFVSRNQNPTSIFGVDPSNVKLAGAIRDTYNNRLGVEMGDNVGSTKVGDFIKKYMSKPVG